MGRYTGKSCRLICMMVMTSTFFLAEITTGYVTDSMALVADSFHMLSDIVSLIVGFVAIKVSKLSTSRNTYGWVRAEIVGALVNGVFLVALCFTIFVEALQRFIEKEIEVQKPVWVLTVGTAGLVVNLLGLCLFSSHGHGHSHGGGGHGHSGWSNFKGDDSTKDESDVAYKGLKEATDVEAAKSLLNKEKIEANGTSNKGDANGQEVFEIEVCARNNISDVGEDDIEAIASGSQLNMRGVFLHVLGDALGSVVVIISALIIWLAEGEWRFYVDPAMSIFICVIILATSVPLLKQSAMILMQSIPSHLDVEDIKSTLEEKFQNIRLHDFHVWQLTTNLTIATAHIVVNGDVEEYMEMSEIIKEFFHKRGIHSTTIQPEFVFDNPDADCVLKCKTDVCDKQRCCSVAKKDSALTISIESDESPPVVNANEEQDDNV